MRAEATGQQPRLDNLSLVSAFPADYLPYADSRRRPDSPDCVRPWTERGPVRRPCGRSVASTVLAIVFLVLAFSAALAISVYFGVLTTMYTSPVFHIFGEMRVTSGEQYDDSLSDRSSENFAFKASNFENRLKSTFLESMFQSVLHDVEVYSFGKPDLTVFFRLHLDRRKASELQGLTHLAKTVLLQEIRHGDVFRDLEVPSDSVVFTEEVCPGSCYVPSTTALADGNSTDNTTDFASPVGSDSFQTQEGETTSNTTQVVPTVRDDLSSFAPSEDLLRVDDDLERNENVLGHRPDNGSSSEVVDLPHPCSKDDFRCYDGRCVHAGARCDRQRDCPDLSDENNCSCAENLRALDLERKICDGFYDCWDRSDERSCAWCSGQVLCPGSETCIQSHQVCDGVRNCPSGFDEAFCMKLSKEGEEREEHLYSREGFLNINREGQWKKLCLDENDVLSKGAIDVERLGRSVCLALTYKNLESIVLLPAQHRPDSYFDLIPPTEKSPVTFLPTGCREGKLVRIKCGNLECGIKTPTQSAPERIVGGSSVTRGTWPWQAALYREGRFQCGGVLISDTWMLSAGHCFYRSGSSHWEARLGLLRRGSEIPSPFEEVRRIVHVSVHPEYSDRGFVNDIALLKLDKPTTFSRYIRPVCLPSPEEGVSKWEGKSCTVVGWGKLTEEGRTFPDTLQEVQLPVISSEECRRRTLFLPIYQITENMFCAGYERGGRDACLGDSGGPMTCQKTDGRWVLMGITSNGDGCARAGRPGVYTQVAGYLDWIRTVMASGDLEEIKSNCSGTRCRLGRCLPPEKVCDGTFDCWDGEDERRC